MPDLDVKSALTPTLTGHDRCDVRECGAQAYVRAMFDSGDLLFCAHHFEADALAISGAAALILDERASLSPARLDVSA